MVPRTPSADVHNPYPPLVIRGVSFAHAHLLLELLQLLLDGVRPLPTATAGRACPAAGPAGACSPTAATGASACGAAVPGRARAGAVSPTRAARVDLLARTPRRARLGVLGVGGTTATGTPPRGTHDMQIHQTGGTPDAPQCDQSVDDAATSPLTQNLTAARERTYLNSSALSMSRRCRLSARLMCP